ncbi:MAG TPA: cyclic nucleotide-binding domain-containing protein [Planctomycetes bacterium]|nr:cyclic nucleotide-binding domain-containing protein [Fuerstiella sp.]HIK91813.1 cyclic nucleotide-binding domain-containing protein [Planctomycetota bacterium]
MSQFPIRSSRRLTNVLSNTVYDIPASMRALTLLVGFAAVVVVIVASLEGGQEHTIEVDKILHFSGYATLAIIFVLGLRPAFFVPVLILLALLGVAIEFLQPLNSRSFDMADAAANVTGLAVGAGLGLILRIVLRYIRTQHKATELKKSRRTFERGSIIMRQGAPVRRFCVIERGEVKVSREVDGEQKTIGTLQEGEIFGLLGLLQNQPQFATIEATAHTSVYSMDLNELIDASGEKSGPVACVLTVMARHLQDLADQVVKTSGDELSRDGALGKS